MPMGKSPAKWIKSVFFGRKLTRSHSSKGRNALKATNNGEYSGGKGSPVLSVSSPVISEPVLVSTDSNGITPELEKSASSNINEVDTLPMPTSQVANNQGSAGSEASVDPKNFREEQAVIKAQAVFRGFLARRAFRALKGIIRLQALIRGHLVRRQAVATLCSMQGIVKLQALVRGQRIRSSGIGLEINTKFGQKNAMDSKPDENWKEKLATNAFLCKLLSPSPVAMHLQIQYDKEESNSAYSWLERWTSTQSWKQHLQESQPKKAIDSKSQPKKGVYKMETESGRPKRAVRRNSSGDVDSSPSKVTSELEKLKRNSKKASSLSVDSADHHPQTELEKVKRNLRKISNSTEVSDHTEIEIEKPNRIKRKVSNTQSEVPSEATNDSVEKKKIDVPINSVVKPDMELVEEPVGSLLDSEPLQSVDIEENCSVMNAELSSKEEHSYENQKTSKRRASFSAKSEYAENGLQNTPPLPSYMAATESAKAKLRGQSSPRFVLESVEKNSLTRRHSLPSSNIGKLSSNSPRTQKLAQGSAKGAARSDKSMLSSRDGNERPVQIEWRR